MLFIIARLGKVPCKKHFSNNNIHYISCMRRLWFYFMRYVYDKRNENFFQTMNRINRFSAFSRMRMCVKYMHIFFQHVICKRKEIVKLFATVLGLSYNYCTSMVYNLTQTNYQTRNQIRQHVICWIPATLENLESRAPNNFEDLLYFCIPLC